MTAARRRSGFTLLEVLLASAIGIMLLGALYVAFDLTLKQSDAAREAANRGDLMRGVANLMTNDLANCIGPMPPKSGGGIPEDTSGGTAPSTAAPSTTTPTTETAADPLAALDLTEGVAAADLPFQGGCFGSDSQLTLFVSGVPPALVNPETANPYSEGMIDTRPDLRRVTYYMSQSGGLCRQERPWVTAEGVRNSADADRSTEGTDVIAPEVKEVTFSYYGPDGWQSSWTGSDPASDGGSVKGPPRAIKITMVIEMPGTTEQKTVSHVIALRAATGLYQPPVPEEGTTSTTETTTGTTPP